MTEREWLTSANALAMLKWAMSDGSGPGDGPNRHSMSVRCQRLFATACCRQVWDLMTHEDSRRAIEIAEECADGSVTEDQRHAAWHRAVSVGMDHHMVGFTAARCLEDREHIHLTPAIVAMSLNSIISPTITAAILRDVIGNPWRPFVLPEVWSVSTCPNTVNHGGHLLANGGVNCIFCPAVLSCPWRTDTVLRLARTIYDSRDFSAAPVLADALEDAGCGDQTALKHLRTVDPILEDGCEIDGCDICDGSGQVDHPSGGVVYCPNGFDDNGRHVGGCRKRTVVHHSRGCHVIDTVLGRRDHG